MNTGVLLMAHGTPSSLEEMPEYLTLVRGGHTPSDELIAEMRHNYEAIGGRSPLTDLTMAQAEALAAKMPGVPIAVGMRNWKPFIKEAVATLVKSGVTRIIGIPLAPQFSSLSVGKYFDVATMALPSGVELVRVETFHAHPLLLDAFTERVRQAHRDPIDAVVFWVTSICIRPAGRFSRPPEPDCRFQSASSGLVSLEKVWIVVLVAVSPKFAARILALSAMVADTVLLTPCCRNAPLPPASDALMLLVEPSKFAVWAAATVSAPAML